EIAGALGFADSTSAGFWEAYAKARTEELEAAEQARVDAADQIVRDAATYGRRVEKSVGEFTQFTELIPPPSGDIVDGEIFIRTGGEARDPATGTVKRGTSYLRGFRTVVFVESEIKDGVETITKVVEFEPGSTDLK